MSQIIPLADIPRVLYLYQDEQGQTMAIAVKQDLDNAMNFTSVKRAMLNPQTPEPVRTMLYNKLFFTRDKGLQYVKQARLQMTPSGLQFFEVHLTKAGADYVKARNGGGHMQAPTFSVFDVHAPRPSGATTKPKPQLEEALNYLGLTP